MESDREYKKLFSRLAMDKDPFKQGTNLCCMAHTSANGYKQSLKAIESYEMGRNPTIDVDMHLVSMERSFKELLLIGYSMAQNLAQIITLEMRE